MRIVTPRFVEIVALSIATEFLKIMIAGAIIMMVITSAVIRIRFLVPVTLSAHMIATMIAISKKRGCINVAKANQPQTEATAIQNFISKVGLRLARMSPAIIMKHDAIGASYPTTNDESERVGLREINNDVQSARNRRELLQSLFVKK